jgi:uncharacterized protein (TIGR00369 family)
VSEYTAVDPDFEFRVRASFSNQSAMDSLGITLDSLGPGWVDLSFEVPPGFTQQAGFVHAGVIAAALDSACGYAAYTLAEANTDVVTSEYKINLLRPAVGYTFVARGWVVRPGTTLTVSQAELTAKEGGPPLAIMTGTIVHVGVDPAGGHLL